jgi:hypothetical protein
MTVIRQKVTDVTARLLTPTAIGEMVRVDTPPVVHEASVRECFNTRLVNGSGEPLLEDPVRAHLQTLVNAHSEHLCVCSPNRADMLAARAEMQAHPGYAEYKARRDAAMAAHSGCHC